MHSTAPESLVDVFLLLLRPRRPRACHLHFAVFCDLQHFISLVCRTVLFLLQMMRRTQPLVRCPAKNDLPGAIRVTSHRCLVKKQTYILCNTQRQAIMKSVNLLLPVVAPLHHLPYSRGSQRNWIYLLRCPCSTSALYHGLPASAAAPRPSVESERPRHQGIWTPFPANRDSSPRLLSQKEDASKLPAMPS